MLTICLSFNRKLGGGIWDGCLFWKKKIIWRFLFFYAHGHTGLGEQMWYELGKFI